MRNLTYALLALLMSSPSISANTNGKLLDLTKDNVSLNGEKAEIVQYQGITSLLLNGGRATLNDITFSNGVIEYDVAFSNKRNFVGVRFRQQSPDNAEEFYIRPHQSGNPDANQYTPVYNGSSAWQLYHRGFAGKVNYKFDAWNRVKIVVAGGQGEVFINDMSNPAFAIEEFLHTQKTGQISFSSAMEDAYFANISITAGTNNLTLESPKTAEGRSQQEFIKHWQVSKSFSDNVLLEATTLKLDEFSDWQTLKADRYGILNMARVQKVTREQNTALAKFSIESNKYQTKALHFGYSDKVKVYVNNRLVYAGNNRFRSRDYRYLGTIGLFDTVYLPLKKGRNDVTFAVTESFGGWGVQAKLEDYDKISIRH